MEIEGLDIVDWKKCYTCGNHFIEGLFRKFYTDHLSYSITDKSKESELNDRLSKGDINLDPTDFDIVSGEEGISFDRTTDNIRYIKLFCMKYGLTRHCCIISIMNPMYESKRVELKPYLLTNAGSRVDLEDNEYNVEMLKDFLLKQRDDNTAQYLDKLIKLYQEVRSAENYSIKSANADTEVKVEYNVTTEGQQILIQKRISSKDQELFENFLKNTYENADFTEITTTDATLDYERTNFVLFKNLTPKQREVYLKKQVYPYTVIINEYVLYIDTARLSKEEFVKMIKEEMPKFSKYSVITPEPKYTDAVIRERVFKVTKEYVKKLKIYNKPGMDNQLTIMFMRDYSWTEKNRNENLDSQVREFIGSKRCSMELWQEMLWEILKNRHTGLSLLEIAKQTLITPETVRMAKNREILKKEITEWVSNTLYESEVIDYLIKNHTSKEPDYPYIAKGLSKDIIYYLDICMSRIRKMNTEELETENFNYLRDDT